MNQINTLSLNRLGKTAAVLTLIIAVLAIFSMMSISNLVVSGDAAATTANIRASEGSFRLGMLSDALIFLLEIVLIGVLYALLKPVNRTLSLTAAFARLAMNVLQGLNLINYFIVLLLLGGAGTLAALDGGLRQSMVMLSLDIHAYVILIWGLFFGLHLLLLGYLVYKSGYIPKAIGILLVLAGLCYLTQSLGNILLPQFAGVFTTIGFISMIELAFPLWLLIKGVKEQG